MRRALPLLLLIVAFAGCGEQTAGDRALSKAQAQYDRCLDAMDNQESIALIEAKCDAAKEGR
jgi:hypothetical protein